MIKVLHLQGQGRGNILEVGPGQTVVEGAIIEGDLTLGQGKVWSFVYTNLAFHIYPYPILATFPCMIDRSEVCLFSSVFSRKKCPISNIE